MPSLHELQRAFARGVLDPADETVHIHLEAARAMEAAAGLAVYRNNAFTSYRSALREAYPVVLRLVGAPFFDHAAAAYVRIAPSTCGDIGAYGATLAAFLEDYPGARELAYLPDVARLEWACHAAFRAAEASPLDIAHLAEVAPEQLGELRFALHPAAALLASRWPILTIWRANQPDRSGDAEIDLGAGGCLLLVMRRGHDVDIEPLSASEYAMLAALAAGSSLGGALECALAVDTGFDLDPFLRHHVPAQTLIDFQPAAQRNMI